MTDEMTLHKGRSSLPAILLIIVGSSFLLFNPGWLEWVASWLRAVLFFAAGALFLSHYRRDSTTWWALLSGFGLLALGAAALGSGAASGPLLLGFLGAGFAAVYRAERRWWALLPAGVLWTLALALWLGETRPGFEAGLVFFFGLAATLGALYSRPGAQRQRWALYPTLGALALALLVFVSSGGGGALLPLLLIAGGAFLLRRDRRRIDDPMTPKGI
jgi:hypothetical protein